MRWAGSSTGHADMDLRPQLRAPCRCCHDAWHRGIASSSGPINRTTSSALVRRLGLQFAVVSNHDFIAPRASRRRMGICSISSSSALGRPTFPLSSSPGARSGWYEPPHQKRKSLSPALFSVEKTEERLSVLPPTQRSTQKGGVGAPAQSLWTIAPTMSPSRSHTPAAN